MELVNQIRDIIDYYAERDTLDIGNARIEDTLENLFIKNDVEDFSIIVSFVYSSLAADVYSVSVAYINDIGKISHVCGEVIMYV